MLTGKPLKLFLASEVKRMGWTNKRGVIRLPTIEQCKKAELFRVNSERCAWLGYWRLKIKDGFEKRWKKIKNNCVSKKSFIEICEAIRELKK